ncbi:MAG: sulfite exporter TauE/SafE family protein [Bryobacteraceae bacterium]|nr:sulfite exporter TauE/SafE family protein [Bryobacteraceae bacterium]
MKRRLAIWIFSTLGLLAHPLGNFSIGQYTGFLLRPNGIVVTYAVDFAEIPSLKLEERWKAGESTDQVMREWVHALRFRSHGKPIEPFHESTSPFPGIGAGGMSTMMIVATLKLPGNLDELEYEDPNFPGRAGWKEITVRAEGVALLESSHQPGRDLSRALTNYPLDAALKIPQDRRARFVMGPEGTVAETKVIPLAQPPAAQSDSRKAEDFSELGRANLLSQLMRRGELPFQLLLTALGIAFAMGAFHALEPGHGKTLVAAYLVGSRGTWQHAVYLGAITTFTHTFTVFVLGLVVLAMSQTIPVERIFPYLSVASALTIVVFGAWLLWKRVRIFQAHHHHHHHHHDHDGHTHDHAPPGAVTMSSLLALGVSGGLVPCPASLVLLLGAMALNRLPLGLGLLVAFSLGMAGVLTSVGVLVVYAKRWLPESAGESHGFHYVAIASAAVMTLIGIGLTVVAVREFGSALGG